MNRIKSIFFLIFLLTWICCSAQKYAGELSEIEFNIPIKKINSFYEMYESKKGFMDFTGIKKGDVIAEIGSAQGMNLGIMSVFCDSVTFFAQDINTKSLSQKNLDKTIEYYSKLRTIPLTNTFKRVIGTIDATNLPDNTFDKIFIVYSFHDFDKKDEMLDDIYKKLKPNGKLIINDGFSFPNDTIKCYEVGCHVFTTLNTELSRFEKHGLYLTGMRSPNFHASNYGNMVIYEKNKEKSDEFYSKINSTMPWIMPFFRLKSPEIASDSLLVKRITDSLLLKINEVSNVYSEIEVWIKELGLKYLRKGQNQAAINILRSNLMLFPNSYQSNYWLGVAYQENKQGQIALSYLRKSLDLNPKNDKARDRIATISKY